jgi:hypothetical protein
MEARPAGEQCLARAAFRLTAESSDELSLEPGEILTVLGPAPSETGEECMTCFRVRETT